MITEAGYTAPPPTPMAISGELSTANTESTSSASSITRRADLDALSLLLTHLHTPNLLALTSPSPLTPLPCHKPTLISRRSEHPPQLISLHDPADPPARAAIRAACEDSGVFRLTGDGIFRPPLMLLEETRRQCHALFVDLHNPVKQPFHCLGGATQRPDCEANVLMAAADDDASFCFHDFDMEDTVAEFTLDENFRDTTTNFVKAISKTSKELLKILAEGLCIATRTSMKHHVVKPILCIFYEHQSNLCSKYIDDAIISIQNFHSHQENMSNSILVAVGKQLQVLSEGKYKAPTFPSLYTNGTNGLCMAVILILQT